MEEAFPPDHDSDRPEAQPESHQRLRGTEHVGQQTGHTGDLGGPGVRCLAVGHDVQLARDEQESDAGEHALDDGHGDGPEPAAQPEYAHEELKQAGGEDEDSEAGEAVSRHGFVDQHRQAGRRAADLETAPRQHSGHQSSDDSRDQTQLSRDTGGDSHPHTQRERHQEHDQGCGEVLSPHGPARTLIAAPEGLTPPVAAVGVVDDALHSARMVPAARPWASTEPTSITSHL